MPLTYDDLRRLTKVTLPKLGLGNGTSLVEDIYPCTLVQEGMLISQLRNPTAYIFHAVYSATHVNPLISLDPDGIRRSWQKVVDRHAALRTVFIECVRRGGVFDQVVMKKVDCGVILLSRSDEEAMNKLGQATIQGADQQRLAQLPHRLTVCTTHSGRVLIKLEVNHAAIDGGSLSIILEELSSAYAGTLDASPGPRYSDYVRYIRSRAAGSEPEYWMRYLKDLQPCYFPKVNDITTMSNTDTRRLCSTTLDFDRYAELRRLSEQMHVTLANIMHAAWAFVLRKYTGSDDVCFGYLTADRDAPIENIRRTVGTLINMLCCRVQISKSQTLEDVCRMTQDQHLESLHFQSCSLARVQHELGLAGKPLYNTSISTQNHTEGEERQGGGAISFEMEEGHDPSEYAITVNVETSQTSEGVVFRYWDDHVSDDQAREVAHSMARILDGFIDRRTQRVEVFDLDPEPKTISIPPPTGSGAEPAGSDYMVQGLVTSIDTLHGDAAIPGSMSSSPTWSIVEKPVSQSTPTSQLSSHRAAAISGDQTLLALWSAQLNLPEKSISRQDNFFDLGGDSILAMKLVGDARDHGLSLTVADVFRHPSFEAMAAIACADDIQFLDGFDAQDGDGTKQTVKRDLYERFSLLAASNVDAFLQTSIVPQVGVFRGGILDVLPATDFQSLAVAGALLQSRWMLNYFSLDGEGPLNIAQLKQACFRLVQSLDILRTVFVPSGGRFLQVILRTLRPTLHVLDVDESLDAFTAKMQHRGHEGGNTPPLGESFVEFTVLRHQPSSRHRILLRISHAQYDGVCLPKILNGLQAAYRGEPVPHPPSFANYLRASAVGLTSEHYQHWKRLLEDSSMTQIVRRNGPNYPTSATGATVCLKRTVHVPPVESGRITTATVIKAAWAYVLAQVSASADVVFGHTISGRNADVEGIENMIGPCLNLVPVRVQFDRPGLTARSLLRQIQDQQVANMPHEVLGFREIVRHCTAWPDWTYFTSTVQHQNLDQSSTVRLGDVTYRVSCASAAQEDFADLSVYSQRLVDSDGTVDAMDDTYEIMLSFAENGGITCAFAERALDMLSEATRLFSPNPDVSLLSVAGLRCKSPRVPFDEVHDDHDAVRISSPGLQSLDPRQQLNLSKLVSKAWREVLVLPDQHTDPNGTPSNETSSNNLDPESSFFDLGGDIIGLAQLAWVLEQEGFRAPRLEDLVEHPTVRGHMALLASQPGAVVRNGAAVDTVEAPSVALPVLQGISRVDSTLAKVLRRAKRHTWRKKGPRCEVNEPAAA